MIESFDELAAALVDMPDDADLVFVTRSGEIKRGYHVTEFKLAQVTSIDCGGVVTPSTEARLQLLDGMFGDAHMQVGKFDAILRASRQAVPGLGAASASVEFAPGNAALQVFTLAGVTLEKGRVVVPLVAKGPDCKAALRVKDRGATTSCCGVGTVTCC